MTPRIRPVHPARRTPLVVAALAALALFAGCDRNDERTVGERVDDATQSAAQTSGTAAERSGAAMERAGDRAENAAERAGNSVERAADAAGDKVADAAITTAVNAELARDPALSALQINVDTANGQVVLRGRAPSAEAKARASTLARGVKGVSGVDNQLEVRG